MLQQLKKCFSGLKTKDEHPNAGYYSMMLENNVTKFKAKKYSNFLKLHKILNAKNTNI